MAGGRALKAVYAQATRLHHNSQGINSVLAAIREFTKGQHQLHLHARGSSSPWLHPHNNVCLDSKKPSIDTLRVTAGKGKNKNTQEALGKLSYKAA